MPCYCNRGPSIPWGDDWKGKGWDDEPKGKKGWGDGKGKSWEEPRELQREEEMRARPLLITFSYWNGSGNRRQVEVKQGDSIEQFLRQVREKLCDEFREVRACAVADLMYIKEDLILPLNLTFHELIVTRARGKSGPLFHFDVHDDVRLRMDARVEKDESHAGKVVERRWYSRHKHIFPYSRWELYDPEKTFERYTVRDSNKTD